MNEASFLFGQATYFRSSYAQFEAFGGPSVYFHRECLRAATLDFMSTRHIETLYATLAAWGMHRMGASDTTKTKLTDWDRFSGSILRNADRLREFRGPTLLGSSQQSYEETVARLRPVYETLDLTASGSTV